MEKFHLGNEGETAPFSVSAASGSGPEAPPKQAPSRYNLNPKKKIVQYMNIITRFPEFSRG